MVSAEGLMPWGRRLLPDFIVCGLTSGPLLQCGFQVAEVSVLSLFLFLFLDIFFFIFFSIFFFLPPQEFERTAAAVALIRAVYLR